jgi:hypothetical protein
MYLRFISMVMLTVLLAACGGGGGSAGSNGEEGVGSGSSGGTVTAVVSDFQLSFNKSTLSNSGGDEVELTVVALNAANNVVSGADVAVSVDSGAVFVGNGVSTAGDGRFTGAITSPSNKSNRLINVSVRVGSIVKASTIEVVGSQISVNVVPGVPTAGQSVAVNLFLRDSAGTGIRGTTLNVSGDFATPTVLTTDNSGAASLTVTSVAPGTYTIVVSGSGVTTTQVVRVSGTTGGGGTVVIPPATSLAPASLNANPTNIRPNLTNSQTNRSSVVFRMRDLNNTGIPNVRVRFEIVPPGLASGEQISTGNNVVLTDSSGEVSTEYIPGTRTSPTNGVRIRACYATTDAAISGTACPNSVEATLTVAGQALNLSIIDDNLLERGTVGNTLYIKNFVIQVADSAGNAVVGAQISASVDITHYGKGVEFASNYPRTVVRDATADYSITLPPGISDTYTSGTLGNTDTTPATPISRIWCLNEDLNRNGNRDAGEDIDGDGNVEPRASEITVSAVGSGVTDATGIAQFRVQYGQTVGTWLAYTLKVTTNVAGSEGMNSRKFITDVLQADVTNGSFLTPPYGGNNCRTNN